MGRIYAEASFEGHVRGYTPHTYYEPEKYEPGLKLAEHIGKGLLSVTRHMPFQKQPHHGTVELLTSEIGEDISHYLVQSHQIRSVISVGVYLDTYGKVQSAGGVLVEVMPGVEEEIVQILQKNAEQLKSSISQEILKGVQAADFVKPFLSGIPYTELEHNYPISYTCPCNEERVMGAIESMGLKELEEMVTAQEKAEVRCQVCGRPYEISVERLTEIKNKLYRQSLN
jgi:molecular chaperone Hsp33